MCHVRSTVARAGHAVRRGLQPPALALATGVFPDTPRGETFFRTHWGATETFVDTDAAGICWLLETASL
jgi:hypothetical protein